MGGISSAAAKRSATHGHYAIVGPPVQWTFNPEEADLQVHRLVQTRLPEALIHRLRPGDINPKCQDIYLLKTI